MVHFFEFYISHTVHVLELILQFNGQCQNFLYNTYGFIYMYTRCLYIIQISHYTHIQVYPIPSWIMGEIDKYKYS